MPLIAYVLTHMCTNVYGIAIYNMYVLISVNTYSITTD